MARAARIEQRDSQVGSGNFFRCQCIASQCRDELCGMFDRPFEAAPTMRGKSMFMTAPGDEMWQNWARTRDGITRRWDQLTPDDLDIISGDRERLIVRIVDRYGIAKMWAEHQVIQWELRET